MVRFFLAAAVVLAAPLEIGAAGSEPDQEHTRFATLSDIELVQRLTDEKDRPRAFYELSRRGRPDKWKDFGSFEAEHYNSTVVVCPQEKPGESIYLVLYGYLNGVETPSSDDYVVRNASELFPTSATGQSRPTEKEPAIAAFTAAGRLITPFGGDNLLTGLLGDVNADGVIERVDSMDYAKEVNNATVLTVSAVKAKAQPLLAVVINLGAAEWTYRLRDLNGDGISEIEAGPRGADGLIPKAVWTWDTAKRVYVGPNGKTGDHFRVINGAAIWKELKRLKASKVSFPKDSEAVGEKAPWPEESSTPVPTPPLPIEPYRYASLKNATDADVLRFMSRGKNEFYREADQVRNRLPHGFWTMEPKAAALALVEANRSERHRATYRLAIDDRDNAQPPPRFTISFSDSSSRCYNAVDGHYFLRVDPEESYLAFARSWSGGVVFYNAVYDQPAFDMRICQVPYQDARRIAEIIWWLDRIRSRAVQASDTAASSPTTAEVSRIISTGDGTGYLAMRSENRLLIEYSYTLWSASLAERWDGEYNHQALLNFAGYVVADLLTTRLDKEWSRFEPTEQRPLELRETSPPMYAEEEKKRLHDFSERFLGWFSPSQEKISLPIVCEAVTWAGEFAVPSTVSRLKEIEAALPPPKRPKRPYSEVSAEQANLPDISTITDPKRLKQVEQRRAALNSEIDAISHEFESAQPDTLRRIIRLSLRKLAVATDLKRLSALAVSSEDEGQWALQRLAQVDRKRYADALETLLRATKGKWSRQFFAELARVDPERATALARNYPPAKNGALTISAFLQLARAGNIPDEKARIATVIKVLHDPKTGWEERWRAIDALVPPDAHLHYPGREIDDALLRLLDRRPGSEKVDFAPERACMALAARGRTEYFDRIFMQLEAKKSHYIEILRALTRLALKEPQRFNSRLVAAIKPELSNTNVSVPDLFWVIWSANLAELQSDLERLATHNTDEYEDKKAQSSGGEISPVAGRFHLARKILALWREPDAVTRGRLLTAFAASDVFECCLEPDPEKLVRLKAEMNRVSLELSGDEKKTLAAFADALAANPKMVDDERADPEMVRKAMAFARAELRL